MLRGHPFRTSGFPGGGGGPGKPDIYCYFPGKSIIKPGQTGEGGLKILIFAGRLKWMALYKYDNDIPMSTRRWKTVRKALEIGWLVEKRFLDVISTANFLTTNFRWKIDRILTVKFSQISTSIFQPISNVKKRLHFGWKLTRKFIFEGSVVNFQLHSDDKFPSKDWPLFDGKI